MHRSWEALFCATVATVDLSQTDQIMAVASLHDTCLLLFCTLHVYTAEKNSTDIGVSRIGLSTSYLNQAGSGGHNNKIFITDGFTGSYGGGAPI